MELWQNLLLQRKLSATEDLALANIQGRPSSPKAMMHSPCFRFPPISEKILDSVENFHNLTFTEQNFRFYPQKVLTTFFSHWPQISNFRPVFRCFSTFSPNSEIFPSFYFSKLSPWFRKIYVFYLRALCVFRFPLLRPWCMHHTMHVRDAPANISVRLINRYIRQ